MLPIRGLFLVAALCWTAVPATTEAETDTRPLVLEVLRASGVESEAERERLAEKYERAVRLLREDLRSERPTYRQARRVHRLLHERYLRDYDEDADALQSVLEDGRYNCLSAALFYGAVLHDLGYEIRVVEIPGHVFLRAKIGERTIEIETTSRHGFDVTRLIRGYPDSTAAADDDLRWLRLAAAVRNGRTETSSWPVTLDEAVGFAWLNSAWRHLGEGRAVRAARSVLEASRFLPRMAERAEGVDRLMSRAFRLDYESGRFARAFRTAEIGVLLRPTTTARDRLYAAALKRVERLCDADRPREAETILERIVALAVPADERARLERGTTPLIAAAAVRLGDFELARRAVARFGEAEPDPVEARRLGDWVELRSRSGPSPETEPAPPLLLIPLTSR